MSQPKGIKQRGPALARPVPCPKRLEEETKEEEEEEEVDDAVIWHLKRLASSQNNVVQSASDATASTVLSPSADSDENEDCMLSPKETHLERQTPLSPVATPTPGAFAAGGTQGHDLSSTASGMALEDLFACPSYVWDNTPSVPPPESGLVQARALSYDLQEGLPLAHDHSACSDRKQEGGGREKNKKRVMVVCAAIGFWLAAVVTFTLVYKRHQESPVLADRPTSTSFIETQSTTEVPQAKLLVEGLPEETQLAILTDRKSPQAVAYTWLKADPFLLNYTQAERRQRLAMAIFYQSTGGSQWTIKGDNQDAWLSYYTSGTINDLATECQWFTKKMEHVKVREENLAPCDGDNEIISISLNENGLQGSIPHEVILLQSLQQFRISGNDIQGTIPSELFTALHNLSSIGLRSNDLVGSIPDTIGDARHMKIIVLMENGLTGQIPASVYTLPWLGALNVGGNQLSGTLSNQVGDLSMLEELNVANNELSGTIPTQLGLLTHLLGFEASSNYFEGTLPNEIGLMTSLTSLYVDNNPGLTGTIPTSVGNLLNLTEFKGGSCSFSGTVPTEVGLLTKLSMLDLSYNQELGGTFPTQLENLNSLQTLNVRETGLTGSIPRGLCSVEVLQFDCSNKLCGCSCPCVQ